MKRNILFLFAVVFLCGACKDFLDMPPKNTKVVYTIDDVREAMSTLLFATTSSSYYTSGTISNPVRFNSDYVQYPFSRRMNVSSILYTNDLDMTNFLFADFANPTRGGQTFSKEYAETKNWEGYKFPEELWKNVFVVVGYINMVMKDLENVPDYDKTIGERISGEARVMRAYYLLRLNQLFAPFDKNEYGIPFNFDADVVQGGKRWKQTDLYAKLIKEITDVLEYETVPEESWNIFFNKRIMYGILAQTYLFKAESCAGEADDWSKAEYYAKAARNGERVENTVEEQFELTTVPFARGVTKPHKFALLRFALYSSAGNDYAPWGRPEQLLVQRPSEELYGLYDENDIRREVYFQEIDGKIYVIRWQATNSHSANDMHALFRFSDLMLIEAEALARQGKDGALELLNEFKSSKIPGYAGYTGSDIIGEILKERRKEFAYEEQMNWLDMKRTGAKVTRQVKDEATNEIVSYTLESDDYRYTFPIPADSELIYNNIPQNPGWK